MMENRPFGGENFEAFRGTLLDALVNAWGFLPWPEGTKESVARGKPEEPWKYPNATRTADYLATLFSPEGLMTMRMPIPLATYTGAKFPTAWTRASRELPDYWLEQAGRASRDLFKEASTESRVLSNIGPKTRRTAGEFLEDTYDLVDDKVRDLWRKFDQPWSIPNIQYDTKTWSQANLAKSINKKNIYEGILAALRNAPSLINNIDSAVDYLGGLISPDLNED